MNPLPPLDEEREELATYSLDDEEPLSEGLVEAFATANIDPFDQPSTLSDWIDIEALDTFRWNSDCPLRIATQVWYHTVVITGEAITIYATLPAQ